MADESKPNQFSTVTLVSLGGVFLHYAMPFVLAAGVVIQQHTPVVFGSDYLASAPTDLATVLAAFIVWRHTRQAEPDESEVARRNIELQDEIAALRQAAAVPPSTIILPAPPG